MAASWRVWLRPEPGEPFEHYSTGAADERQAVEFAAKVYLLGRMPTPKSLTGTADRICGAVAMSGPEGGFRTRHLCTKEPRHEGAEHRNDTSGHAWAGDATEASA